MSTPLIFDTPFQFVEYIIQLLEEDKKNYLYDDQWLNHFALFKKRYSEVTGKLTIIPSKIFPGKYYIDNESNPHRLGTAMFLYLLNDKVVIIDNQPYIIEKTTTHTSYFWLLSPV